MWLSLKHSRLTCLLIDRHLRQSNPKNGHHQMDGQLFERCKSGCGGWAGNESSCNLQELTVKCQFIEIGAHHCGHRSEVQRWCGWRWRWWAWPAHQVHSQSGGNSCYKTADLQMPVQKCKLFWYSLLPPSESISTKSFLLHRARKLGHSCWGLKQANLFASLSQSSCTSHLTVLECLWTWKSQLREA